MKILKRIIIASIIIILAVIISFISIFIYDDQYKQREIYREISPNGNHTVFLYQIGNPQWSFGSVNAKLVLRDTKGKKVDEDTFSLANDGGSVIDANIVEIVWADNQVEIQMKEFDTTQLYTYILEYND